MFRRCHGLVPWSFTLVPTCATQLNSALDATALRRGGSRSPGTSVSSTRQARLKTNIVQYESHAFFIAARY